jgi:16S rRNA (guanine(966)-N(2))-methyltransferase RsmD
MRVISGSAKGRGLFAPKGLNIRPTAGRVKEALFSMLTPYVEGAVFLDLFAGTGAIGIEALSRGAKEAVFVDNSRRSLEFVKRNLEHCGFIGKARIIYSDVCAFLKQRGESYDIIFLDPPYGDGRLDGALELIKISGVLSKDALCAAECSINNTPAAEGFDIFKNKRYNSVNIILYKLREGDFL